MDVKENTEGFTLGSDEAAIVFRTKGVEVLLPKNDDTHVASPPMQMAGIMASLLGKDNRDLWSELLSRFHEKSKENDEADSGTTDDRAGA
jgi:hypothetical protein